MLLRLPAGSAEVRDVLEFDKMVAARGTALLRFAVMLCGDAHLAEDLVQSALAKAYRRWDTILKVGQPEAYLKKMIVNEHLSWWRRRSSQELPSSATGVEAMADAADRHASRDAAWELLARLPRRQRAVLVLRYYKDLSDEQIADVLGCGVKSASRTGASPVR